MNTTDCEKIEENFIKDLALKNNNEGYQPQNENFTQQYVKDVDVLDIPTDQLRCLHLKDTKEGGSSCSEDFATDFDDPLSERWSPLGANYDDAPCFNADFLNPESELTSSEITRGDTTASSVNNSRMKNMEEEQELLISSLMALTSHFAHVQLRVRQIVEAPSNKRDVLLKDLEEFAFRGIPEPLPSTLGTCDDVSANVDGVRQRQFELIEHLKKQLSELENFAYDSGAPVLPQHILLEKQKIIIDELKNKLNLKVSEKDLPQLSSEDLRNHVDTAFGEFVGPLKMKEQLVAQLKTQITDLERFIAFLQCDSDDSKLKTLSGGEKINDAYNSYAAKKKRSSSICLENCVTESFSSADKKINCGNLNSAVMSSCGTVTSGKTESLNSKAHGLMDKASMLMEMFAATHFGSKADRFQKNILKKTSKGNHWGDLRAQLEVDIQEVASLAATLSFDREKLANLRKTMRKKTGQQNQEALFALNTKRCIRGSQNELDCSTQFSTDSDGDEEFYNWEKYRKRVAHNTRNSSDSISIISKELTMAVRKNFTRTLQQLIQHGLRAETESTSSLIVPFMRCFNPSPMYGSHSYQSYSSTSTSSFMVQNNNAYSSDVGGWTASNHDDNDQYDANSYFSSNGRRMHAWELILEYYHLKNGEEYNNTPARKLSQSFNLDIVGSKVITSKQSLLSVIGMIITLHRPYKRSYNTHFKAFVCAGLNSHQLVDWFNAIFCCADLVETYYTPGSYVARTAFRDSLSSIDVLTKYDFDLPIDLAVRHFRNI